MRYQYRVVRHTFGKGGKDNTLTLPPGDSIVQVIDKFYETTGVTLVLLIGGVER